MLLLKNIVPFIVEMEKYMQINIKIATETKLAFCSYKKIKNESKNILPLLGKTN
jgi:hypothetical protein